MTQCNTLNMKLSNWKIRYRKWYGSSFIKILSNVYGDSNNENNFPYKLLLTNIQVSRLRKAFENNSSVNIEWSKTKLHKIRQSIRTITENWIAFNEKCT